jgi:hypothetical protein
VDARLTALPDVVPSSSLLLAGVIAAARAEALGPASVVVEAGWLQAVATDADVRAIPVRVGVELAAPLDVVDLRVAAGARVAATPTWMSARGKSGMGVGVSTGPYARVSAPLAGALRVVAEAGVELRALRARIVSDDGVHEEGLFAAPLALGMEAVF